MKNFDTKYNDLPKTEIHIHLEGSIRTQTGASYNPKWALLSSERSI
jgi:adenosine deaminase